MYRDMGRSVKLSTFSQYTTQLLRRLSADSRDWNGLNVSGEVAFSKWFGFIDAAEDDGS